MIRFVEETGSTNADLAEALRSDNPPVEGDWLVARRQTAGRGRQGREWFDGEGNFMGSTVAILRAGDPPPATLSFVAALSVADAVDEVLLESSHPVLKWPNDVLLGGGKLSGILLEMVRDHVIVGIGVNLQRAPNLPDRKTAAITDYMIAPCLSGFADLLAERFESRLGQWRKSGLSAVLSEFLAYSYHSTGSRVTVHDTDGSCISGTFAGLEETDGALRLRLADGSERVIRAGDIT